MGSAVGLLHLGAGDNGAGVGSQPQGAALGYGIILVRQEIDDLVGALVVKFAGVGVGHTGHAPGEGDDADLHTQADAEVGHMVLPAVVGGGDHALDATGAEAAGDDDPGAVLQDLCHVFPGDGLGVDPPDVYIRSQLVARVAQSLGNG